MFQVREGRRATRRADAPASERSAAVSSADWPAPIDDDPPTSPPREIRVLRRMGAQIVREPGQFGRYAWERGGSDREHHPAGGNLLARLEREHVAIGGALEFTNLFVLDRKRKLAREPLCVGTEKADRDRWAPRGVVNTVLDAIPLERQRSIGIREVARHGLRSQQHAGGHAVSPGLHGTAEDPKVDSSPLQVSGERQSVGACAHDGDRQHAQVFRCVRRLRRASRRPSPRSRRGMVIPAATTAGRGSCRSA